MIWELLNDPNTGKYAVFGSIVFFGGLEYILGHYKNTRRTKHDYLVEFLGLVLLTINSFVVLFGIIYLGQTFFPEAYNSFSELSLWWALPLLFIRY